MTPAILLYFKAEKAEALVFITAGLAATAYTAWAYFMSPSNPDFYRGMAIPVAVVGLIQLIVGGTVFFRSDSQMDTADVLYLRDKKAFTEAELPRMTGVMRNFRWYRWTEIGFILTGLALIFTHEQPDFWKGIGAGLALQGGIMLLLDFFAEKRGWEYVKFVEKAR